MITILDIAKDEATKLADASIAVRAKMAETGMVHKHFLKTRFNHLYRRYMMNTVGRRISNRECDIAFQKAQEDQPNG